MKSIALLVYATLVGIPLAAWSAFVAIQLWLWFVTPAFGWTAPSLWLMAGLLVLVRYATMMAGVKTSYDDIDTTLGKAVYITVLGVLLPALTLFSGFVYHLLSGV